MGFADPYDVWVTPLVREAPIFFPMFFFWFVVQIVCTKKLPSWTPNWKRLSPAQQEDMVIRSCSIVNGLLQSFSAVLFVRNLVHNGGQFPADQYQPLPYYRFSRVTIVSYFAWDIFVCFYYKWSLAWKLHGVFSFLGTYTLMFPFAEDFAGYYTGCFELSNGFLHASVILRMLSQVSDAATQADLIKTFDARATICEYLFALLYLLIRVIGGSYVTFSWMLGAGRNMWHDVQHRNVAGAPKHVHDETALVIAFIAISAIQLLQYVWFGEIVKKATGGGAEAEKKEKKE